MNTALKSAMGVLHLLFITLSVTAISAHNITQILSPFPEYSQFNTYLTQTKLSDEINSRDTITVLVLNNAAISVLATEQSPLSVVKKVLSLHVLLDYFDAKKLHQISAGTALSTTLYQTTGDAQGKLGFVNITDLKGGKVGFGSAADPPGAALNSTYVKEVKTMPYHISVLEISEPIFAPGILAAPSASNVNISALLVKAGCKKFVSLIEDTGVLKMYETASSTGLTVFAPSDGAFKAQNAPDLSKLNNAEMVSLLQYHALSRYAPKGTLKTTKGPISTMATNGVGKYDLTVTTAGDEVTLGTGYASSRIASTVIDSPPVVIYTVDSLLLPPELSGSAPSTAPVASPLQSPSPVVSAKAPSPVIATSPSSVFSPPAPPMESPEGSPVGAPDQPEDSKSAGDVKAPALSEAILSVSVAVIFSVFLS
ncbi:hypothetical protein RHSIM_Rhsim07G0025400 [Rhododendron simsii]|uniref:FAS1 domain-containing protein n=1 Tax=Rhododendron simsii TaxID=118357 RepID=A0A834LKZ2_RHOSS|nr:hypothetical protein RHSIM_Rhsim07G0025400 [Rhododendron simsii]